jgi:hypothetical protein
VIEDAEPTPNMPLLRKTFDWVTEQNERAEAGLPSEWDQGTWVRTGNGDFHDALNIRHELLDTSGGVLTARTDKIPEVKKTLAAMAQNCGTACCVAGYVTLLDHPFEDAFIGTAISGLPGAEGTALVDPEDYAREALGLTEDEANELFSGGNEYGDIKRVMTQIAERAGERL